MTNSLQDQETCTSTSCCQKEAQHQEVRTIQPNWKQHDDGETLTVRVALPGVSKNDLALSAKDQRVTLQAPRSGSSLRYELDLELSRDLDPGSISAKLTDGVLKLDFSRKEESKPRTVPVEG